MTNATVYLNELNGFIMWPLIQGFLPLFQPPVRWWEQGPWRCRWHSTPCLDPRSCSCLRCHDAIPWFFSLCRIAKSERVCPQKRNIFRRKQDAAALSFGFPEAKKLMWKVDQTWLGKSHWHFDGKIIEPNKGDFPASHVWVPKGMSKSTKGPHCS